MAQKPSQVQSAPKKTGPIGAYRVEGGLYASYDAEGRTKIISKAEAEALGLKDS